MVSWQGRKRLETAGSSVPLAKLVWLEVEWETEDVEQVCDEMYDEIMRWA